MHEFRLERHIDAPVDHVWAVLADVQRWPEWTSSIERIDVLTAPPLGVGRRALIRQPRLRPAVWEITVWEPRRRFEWQSVNVGVRVIADHLLEPSDKGCLATHSVRFEGALSGLVRLLAGRLTERYAQMEADGLKSRAERAR